DKLKGSAARPYTVSVGIATTSPCSNRSAAYRNTSAEGDCALIRRISAGNSGPLAELLGRRSAPRSLPFCAGRYHTRKYHAMTSLHRVGKPCFPSAPPSPRGHTFSSPPFSPPPHAPTSHFAGLFTSRSVACRYSYRPRQSLAKGIPHRPSR